MTPRAVQSLLLTLGALLGVAGCAADTGPGSVTVELEVDRFPLAMSIDGERRKPTWATLGISPGAVSAYQHVRDEALFESHWLNVIRFDEAPLELAPGDVFVDGPAVDGRGTLADWMSRDGWSHPDYEGHEPWLDLELCDADPAAGDASGCRLADVVRVEVHALAGEPELLELRYYATFAATQETATGVVITARSPAGIENLGPGDLSPDPRDVPPTE